MDRMNRIFSCWIQLETKTRTTEGTEFTENQIKTFETRTTHLPCFRCIPWFIKQESGIDQIHPIHLGPNSNALSVFKLSHQPGGKNHLKSALANALLSRKIILP